MAAAMNVYIQLNAIWNINKEVYHIFDDSVEFLNIG